MVYNVPSDTNGNSWHSLAVLPLPVKAPPEGTQTGSLISDQRGAEERQPTFSITTPPQQVCQSYWYSLDDAQYL